ncbi:MAG TPA: hypothetical protein VFR37_10430 [Longimicrobium sp.]|nr:hypothetical protein [Longimicrobium sp.]
MKKLRLDVDTLAVTSFPTAPDAEEIGTVYAAEVEAFATRTSCGGGYPPCTCPPPTD